MPGCAFGVAVGIVCGLAGDSCTKAGEPPPYLETVIQTPPISLESPELFLMIRLRLMCSVSTLNNPWFNSSGYVLCYKRLCGCEGGKLACRLGFSYDVDIE